MSWLCVKFEVYRSEGKVVGYPFLFSLTYTVSTGRSVPYIQKHVKALRYTLLVTIAHLRWLSQEQGRVATGCRWSGLCLLSLSAGLSAAFCKAVL